MACGCAERRAIIAQTIKRDGLVKGAVRSVPIIYSHFTRKKPNAVAQPKNGR